MIKDRNTLVFVGISVVFYLVYTQYMNNKYPDRFAPQTQTQTITQPASPAPSSATGPASLQQPGSTAPLVATEQTPTYPALDDSELTLRNPDVTYVLSQETAGLKTVMLNQFENDARSGKMLLVDHGMTVQPLTGTMPRAPLAHFKASRDSAGKAITFEHVDGPWTVTQTYTIPESGFGMQLDLTWKNTSSQPTELVAGLLVAQTVPYAEKSSSFLPGMPTSKPQIASGIAGQSEWSDIQEYCTDDDNKGALISKFDDVDFIGIDTHYFLAAFLPKERKAQVDIRKVGAPFADRCPIEMTLRSNHGLIAPGDGASRQILGWFGPKSGKAMAMFEPKLENSLDFGFFSKVGQALLAILQWVHLWVGNWGLAIIVFTIILKFAFYPLTRAAAISMKRMQKLQPEMNRIKEQHKADPRMQQQEIMRFMSTHKINPMKGCLPILPQIPVFFAFYRVLSTSVELRHAPFLGWIHDLSSADPYYITPILLAAGMFLQQKLTPMTTLDKTQERIMMMFPLVFSFMMIGLPAGLVIYMLTNTIVSIGQQQWLNRKIVV